MISIVVFVVAGVVSIVLDRQERRHKLAIELEYERLEWELPPAKPKLSRTVAVLNICLRCRLARLRRSGVLRRSGLSSPRARKLEGSTTWRLFLAVGDCADYGGWERAEEEYEGLGRRGSQRTLMAAEFAMGGNALGNRAESAETG